MTESRQQTLEEARRTLASVFDYPSFLPGQEVTLASVFSGRHVLAVMPTGSGKSLLYQLPAVMSAGVTVVISPLISLMKDQVDELLRKGVSATFVNSSLVFSEQMDRLRRCANGEIKLLYIAPERFRNRRFTAILKDIRIARMAVDEAHCISEWGHDFRPDYLRLKYSRELLGNPQIIALTATATVRVQQDIIQALGLEPGEVDVHVHGFDRPNLVLEVVDASTDKDKLAFLSEFIREHPGSGIIYTGTRGTTEKVCESLREIEPATGMYHAGMDAVQRTRAQDDFISGKHRVVVATSAFGMGIDKPDVRFVIHFNFPGSVEQYYQEIGRAGRDGKESRCVLLYSYADRYLREFFIDLNYPPEDVIEEVISQLWAMEENPILLTYKEIAEICEGKIKEGQIGAVVRLLDQAGLTKASESRFSVGLVTDAPVSELIRRVHGKNRKLALEGAASLADMETPGRFEISLRQLCYAVGLDEDQVRRAFTAMDQAGILRYEPPFRGRGIYKLVDTLPEYDELPIDWEKYHALRRAEEEKLEVMERYILHSACRRGFILEYFGEQSGYRCGVCDRCAVRSTAQRNDVLLQEPDVALAVLMCMKDLRFPLGKGKIAQVVTGSKDQLIRKWRLHRNPAYGTVRKSQNEVKHVIDRLLREGYIQRSGDRDRPVLVLTAAGLEAAFEAVVEFSGAGRSVAFQNPEIQAAPPPEMISPPANARKQPAEGKQPGRKRETTPLKKQPDMDPDALKRACLKCVADLPVNLGMGKVAAILTGSKANWVAPGGFHRMETYGAAKASQEKVKKMLRRLVAEGLLEQSGNRQYPVLEITGDGRKFLEHAGAGAPVESGGTNRGETPGDLFAPTEKPPETDFGDHLKDTIESLIRRLARADRNTALKIFENLKLVHPDVILETAGKIFREESIERRKLRCIWLCGELCGENSVGFLKECLNNSNFEIRKHAQIALEKISGGKRGT